MGIFWHHVKHILHSFHRQNHLYKQFRDHFLELWLSKYYMKKVGNSGCWKFHDHSTKALSAQFLGRCYNDFQAHGCCHHQRFLCLDDQQLKQSDFHYPHILSAVYCNISRNRKYWIVYIVIHVPDHKNLLWSTSCCYFTPWYTKRNLTRS